MTRNYEYPEGDGFPMCLRCGCPVVGVRLHDEWHDRVDSMTLQDAERLMARASEGRIVFDVHVDPPEWPDDEPLRR